MTFFLANSSLIREGVERGDITRIAASAKAGESLDIRLNMSILEDAKNTSFVGNSVMFSEYLGTPTRQPAKKHLNEPLERPVAGKKFRLPAANKSSIEENLRHAGTCMKSTRNRR